MDFIDNALILYCRFYNRYGKAYCSVTDSKRFVAVLFRSIGYARKAEKILFIGT